MDRITVSKDAITRLIETVEDAVEFSCSEAFKDGDLMAGETAWKVISIIAEAKVLEVGGKLSPKTAKALLDFMQNAYTNEDS